jgi:hypothetical protein
LPWAGRTVAPSGLQTAKITLTSFILAAILSLIAAASNAAEPFRYPEGRSGKAELRYINGLPVLTVEGSPEEIGAQIGELALKPSHELVLHFGDYMKNKGLDSFSPIIFRASESLYRRFPDERRREIEAMIKASGVNRDLVLLGNTVFELQQILVGCSGFIVSPERSATGGTLYGRNFDFPFKDKLEEYSLVIVYRPTGKKAFAMVTFPGILAASCGMNQDGLTLGANTVTKTGDHSPSFNPEGVPYTVAARDVMENLASVDEFDRWLHGYTRTGMGLLLACDRNRQRVYEITTKNIGVREPEDGLVYCTNHFRVAPMAVPTQCRRYAIFEKNRDLKKYSVQDVARLMNDVNQGYHTIQTMVFEPAELVIHLSIGSGPASAKPLKRLDLKPLLQGK